MAIENLIDKVEIYIRSGHGGAGAVHFRHDKFIEKGGPDGGDGGKGGGVIFVGDKGLATLYQFRHKRHYVAYDGQKGGENNCHGKDAEDIIIKVPLGTTIIDKTTGEIIADIVEDGQLNTILKGGKGGLGNTHFKNSINQTPRYAQEGLPGEERNIILELKLLADVGFVGLPNAGKSTLLSVISNAKPKIGDYAFTTLSPQLGIVNHKNYSFVAADMPGIIEGAAEGKGLGFQFLQHIQRMRILVYVIDINDDITTTLNLLKKEIEKYNPLMLQKKSLLCISKSDTVTDEIIENLNKKININSHIISAITKKGINTLLDELITMLS